MSNTITSTIESSYVALALEQSFNAVLITDAGKNDDGHRIVYANRAFTEMSGYSVQELYGKNPRILQGAETNKDVIERLKNCLRNGEYFQGSTVNYRKNGRPYNVEWNISPVKNANGNIEGYISIQQDISSLVAAQKTSQLFAHVLNATDDGVLITDQNGIIQFVNKGFEKITGYSVSEVLGLNPSILKSNKQSVDFYKEMWRTLKKGHSYKALFVNHNKNNEVIYCDETITPLTDQFDRITHYVSIFRDQTTRILEEQMFREMTKVDRVTGVLTRAAGEIALEESFIQSRESDLPMTIALADIDHFKCVNDTWGHSVGDEILKYVAMGLTSMLRTTDSVIRWGGEEFLLIFFGCNLQQASILAERCRNYISEHPLEGKPNVTISLGIGEINGDESLPDFIDRVDRALYKAKNQGRNRVQTSNANFNI